MRERLRFGIDTPESIQQTKPTQLATMFPDGADLPLFSGTPIPAIERPFVPEDASLKQTMLPGMPEIDYERVLQADKALRGRRRTQPAISAGDIFVTTLPPAGEPVEPAAGGEKC